MKTRAGFLPLNSHPNEQIKLEALSKINKVVLILIITHIRDVLNRRLRPTRDPADGALLLYVPHIYDRYKYTGCVRDCAYTTTHTLRQAKTQNASYKKPSANIKLVIGIAFPQSSLICVF